jgi:hypothetical protein
MNGPAITVIILEMVSSGAEYSADILLVIVNS